LAFFAALDRKGLDARALGALRIAVIGPGTADALACQGLRADLIPDRFVAESLVDAFPAPSSSGARVLLARAETARDVLPEGLARLGYETDVLAVYRTVTAAPDPDALARAATADAITFTSSSTVTNYCDIAEVAPSAAVVSIGPVTSETARARGLTIAAEADPHTIDGVVDAVLALLR
jgi:uroporphyrinogen-III synthase